MPTPDVLGSEERERRREAARAALAQMMPSGSLEGIGEPNMPPPGSTAEPDSAPPLPPIRPEPPPSARDEAQAADAQRVGDAYRSDPRNRSAAPFWSQAAYSAGLDEQGNSRGASPTPAPPAAPPPERPAMQLDPVMMNTPEDRAAARAAPSQPMGPLSRPGESAAVMGQVAPQAPQAPAPHVNVPADRARLQQMLAERRGIPPRGPNDRSADGRTGELADRFYAPTPPLRRGLSLSDPRDTPEDQAVRDRFAEIRRDRQAQLDRGEVPREIHPEPSLPPPQPPRPVRPGGPAAQLDDPGPDAMPPGEFVDPSAPPPNERARLEQLLRARQAQRPLPSASPAGAPDPTAAPVRDFTGADWHDAIRRPLHAIGNALQAAGGRPATPFRSEREQLEARFAREDAQRTAAVRGEREAASAARDADLDERRLTLAERTAASQEELGRERNEISRDMQAGRLDVSRERAESSRQQAEVTGQLAQARLAGIADENARDAAALDPASEPSQIARLSLGAAIAGYPPAARARLAQQMGVDEAGLDEALSGLNMRQAEQLRDDLPSMFRDTTNRRGGAPGTGGGASSASREVLSTAPEGWQGTPEQWAALRPQDQRRIIGQLGSRAPGEDRSEGTEILPGVVAPMRMSQGAVEALRGGIADAGASAANIRGLATVHERYGGLGARISREAQAEIVPRLTIARAMVAQMGGTGVINPTEIDAINAALPNPGDLSGWTFQTFNRRMATWNDILESRVRSQLASRGVDDAGIERALQTVRTGSWSQGGGRGQPARRGGDAVPNTVRVRHPDGRTGTIPRARLEAARSAGFEEAD